ncbi:hypothetical protein [Sutcliffiella horikoshii]|uniref:hypothetical protein n=1 Tax=Sutcliffiella horikoshii TaxID=79883 RepID=UPI001F378326|nr:hypothetical protein [Sutcliffiella horikoshii]MCG1020766.1 hypothetical protein [Sutcliffiella horikoshii]
MENTVGKILQILGFIVIGIGVLLAIIFASETGSIGMALSALFTSSVGGMVLIGFAEIIRLLERVVQKVNPFPSAAQSIKSGVEVTNQPVGLTEENKEEIKAFLQKNDIQYDRILSTPREDFFIVVLKYEAMLIELGGFQPKLISKEKWPHDLKHWYEAQENNQ